MKFRKDFVTNSSSSSFVCDICGNVESGWDMSLQEAEMVECVNGHTICQDEMLSAPREVMLRLIQEEMQQSWSRFNGMTDTELNEKTDEELEEMMLEKSAAPSASLSSIPTKIWQSIWKENIKSLVMKFSIR